MKATRFCETEHLRSIGADIDESFDTLDEYLGLGYLSFDSESHKRLAEIREELQNIHDELLEIANAYDANVEKMNKFLITTTVNGEIIDSVFMAEDAKEAIECADANFDKFSHIYEGVVVVTAETRSGEIIYTVDNKKEEESSAMNDVVKAFEKKGFKVENKTAVFTSLVRDSEMVSINLYSDKITVSVPLGQHYTAKLEVPSMMKLLDNINKDF